MSGPIETKAVRVGLDRPDGGGDGYRYVGAVTLQEPYSSHEGNGWQTLTQCIPVASKRLRLTARARWMCRKGSIWAALCSLLLLH